MKKYARFCTFRNTDGDWDCNHKIVTEDEMITELTRKTEMDNWAKSADVVVHEWGNKIVHDGATVVCFVLQ
jgi:hypothetical protein